MPDGEVGQAWPGQGQGRNGCADRILVAKRSGYNGKPMLPPVLLGEWLLDARQRTLALVEDLKDEQWIGPRLKTVNPFLWELGHVGWFQEHWVLRQARHLTRPLRDDLYDSSQVPHDKRWDLPLPSPAATRAHLRTVVETVIEGLPRLNGSSREQYFLLLAIFHEDMHGEAFWMTRQTLAYPTVSWTAPAAHAAQPSAEGDAHIPGGTFVLGTPADAPFLFDNEKWPHAVRVEPFAIKRLAESQAEFAAFVEDAGYARAGLWSDAGWRWRQEAQAEYPLHWRRDGETWLRRHFDCWVELEPTLPVHLINHFEAEAYCRWAGRRLPTELEWEVAAAAAPDGSGAVSSLRRPYPWGESFPDPEHALLDGRTTRPVDVRALAPGDSAWGCRQMLGNVWEWTASDFLPYPGFSPDPYEDYSLPWFATHKVLKGGSWATRSRLVRPAFRNFYMPDRRDVFAGFRTCALR
jgi:gamma-glutamyl hercynylcysteine S-oxide synthase